MRLIEWFRERWDPAATAERARVGEALERIVQLTNPRLRFARQYKTVLLPAVSNALDYARDLVGQVAPARHASAGAWQSDPCIRSFFATARGVSETFSRSPDVRSWFRQNPAAQQIAAVLSMQLVERRVLGVAVDGGVLRRDVAQTTVSFSDYRVRICAADEAALREDLERRVVDQLGLTAMGTVAEDKTRREALEQERALLRTRLRLLEIKGAGLSGLGLRVNPALGEVARVQMDLAMNEQNLRSLASGTEGLQHQLEQLRLVLSNPAEHFSVSGRRLRVDNMNILLPADSAATGATLDLQIARVPVPDGPPEFRTFVLVLFPRSELLLEGELLSEAASTLH